MGSRRSLTIAATVALVAAAAAAAIVLNLALLGYAQPKNDPVGKLSPRAVLTGKPTPRGVRTQTVTVSDDSGRNDD